MASNGHLLYQSTNISTDKKAIIPPGSVPHCEIELIAGLW